MISVDILKLRRNDIFCYIGILEEPGDVEWYYNRFFDEEKRRRDKLRKDAVKICFHDYVSFKNTIILIIHEICFGLHHTRKKDLHVFSYYE